jgi:hypothetical protein
MCSAFVDEHEATLAELQSLQTQRHQRQPLCATQRLDGVVCDAFAATRTGRTGAALTASLKLSSTIAGAGARPMRRQVAGDDGTNMGMQPFRCGGACRQHSSTRIDWAACQASLSLCPFTACHCLCSGLSPEKLRLPHIIDPLWTVKPGNGAELSVQRMPPKHVLETIPAHKEWPETSQV